VDYVHVFMAPLSDDDKILFLDELRHVRTGCTGSWLLCGDFSMIYKAGDKINSRLNRRMMSRFRHCISDA
jgi:hypothetical protein